MDQYYDWFKAIHVIAVICWMAGQLYLPRIYVYHTGVKPGGEADLVFQKMEYRLLRYIMNPAMVLTIVFGFLMAHVYGFSSIGGWFYAKVGFVFVLAGYHGFLSSCRKAFEKGENKFSSGFFRFANEFPTLLMVIIVFLVVLKPEF